MVKQFLTFKLDGSQYAVEVAHVQEVLEFTRITKIPCAEAHVEGLINSRGQGIMVINMRKKFGLEPQEPAKETRIIVLEIVQGEKTVTFGAIADSVQEVIDLEDTELEPSPKFGNSVAAEFICGLGKRDGAFIIILDVNKLFSTDEIDVLDSGLADNAVAEAVGV